MSSLNSRQIASKCTQMSNVAKFQYVCLWNPFHSAGSTVILSIVVVIAVIVAVVVIVVIAMIIVVIVVPVLIWKKVSLLSVLSDGFIH